MRKIFLLVFVCVITAVVMTACGEKSQEEVVQDLDKKLQDMDGYKGEATMTLETGEEPRTYDVDIWHMQNEKNKYYKVHLKNDNEEQNQMIIRNDDGVFVLTPALNKSFRFQSDWPNNNSQVYLYESLISDILMDAERTFAIHEGTYVFETKTNYQNKNLHHQEIVLDSKSLEPKTVKIYDADYKLLVSVEFTEFDENASFDDNDFDTDKNMTAAAMEEDVPVSTEDDENNEEENAAQENFEAVYPSYQPQGSTLNDKEETMTENGPKVVLSYSGDQSFTIVQQVETAEEAAASVNVGNGQPVDLGFTVAAQAENSLTWHYNGVEYFIASHDLSQDEMTAIARSMNETSENIK
ncbi:Outer membrane lipoprotein-sorting protein [Alteribacillus persepolensis]|uniref:Outer membrane lipoprotein-sorting protein n=1 Tax=Alteribacillus persepolensis TaxID=568899 RepID=A0A1G8FGC8_9BACI|nr:outer membrane lipoprotein carrier protein LolA [Alteribacillus persepolensis]SDH81187.1 Outer membrane lipoprotein-sorting protein [Alteribacillus persepolensis]